ncbi:MAG: formyltetrahydrofolate deformylase [Acidobacteria bacterium]|nr:MAG: formyltetrahydrofolate deformylase [Acidobacteriota bacterium]
MAPHSNAILLISSPDRKGLVARISDFIYQHDGNILHADEHMDEEAKRFLMRMEWDLADFTLAREEIPSAFAPLAEELDLSWQIVFTDHSPKTSIFVSKVDHCLFDLLLRNRAGELKTDFSLVVSNHADLRPVSESFGIEYLHFPVTKENKTEMELAILKELCHRGIELIVLARYMQILSEDFVRHFPHRIINIHHSFLPAFIGANPYRQAYQRGVKLVGATSHYVTADLDNGPIIAQDVMRISHRDSLDDLVRKGRDLEKVVLARAVKLHLDHRVLVYGNKTAVFE